IGPFEFTFLMALMSLLGTLRLAGGRLTAEIEADHYQVLALKCIRTMRPDDPIFSGKRGGSVGASLVYVNDTNMNEPDNRERNATLSLMWSEASRGRLRPCEDYLWHRAWWTDGMMALERILLLALCAAVVGVRQIEITPWLMEIWGACALCSWR